MPSESEFLDGYGIAIYNASGETIPPFGCMQIDLAYEGGLSGTYVRDNETIVQVAKPNSDGVKHPGLILFNSNLEVPPSRYGKANTKPICLAVIDAATGAPAAGGDVGPISGSWFLSGRSKGFKVKSYDSALAYYQSPLIRSVFVEPDSNLLELVLVTSEEPDEYGYYDGVVQRYDTIGMTFISLYTCKVLDANT
jgi:hypothetical protein